MKKLFAVLLSAALLAVSAAGCSGGASEAGRAPDNGAPAKHCPKPWCSPGRPAYRILFRDAIRRQESPPPWAGARRQRALRSFSARSASRFMSRRAASSRLS